MPRLSVRIAGLIIAVAAQLILPPEARAQSTAGAWPQRNVRLILPFGAGSGADIAARLLSERLQSKWKQAIVVENRPGGDALLSIGAFVSAKDDHVLFWGPTSVYLVHPYRHANLPYDPDSDLVPVVQIAKTQVVIGVPAAMPVSSLKDFVAHVKANAGKLNYATTPGFSEFVFDGFLKENDLLMSKVPYRDIVQAPVDLAENRLQALMQAHAVILPQVQAKRVKLLGIADTQRSTLDPDVPSVHEAGFPSLESIALLGAYGPKGMPLELRKRIAEDITAELNDPAVDTRLRASGNVPAPGGPEELAKSVARQKAQVAGIAKVLGVSKLK